MSLPQGFVVQAGIQPQLCSDVMLGPRHAMQGVQQQQGVLPEHELLGSWPGTPSLSAVTP
jgi:hypothetical protein